VSDEVLNSTAQSQLCSIVDRVDRLMDDRDAVNTDIKEVFAEAKANGFDSAVLRKVVALLRKDRAKRQEEEAVMDLYLAGLGEV
jgi:uncharacterized protein (UPF0335 family)